MERREDEHRESPVIQAVFLGQAAMLSYYNTEVLRYPEPYAYLDHVLYMGKYAKFNATNLMIQLEAAHYPSRHEPWPDRRVEETYIASALNRVDNDYKNLTGNEDSK